MKANLIKLTILATVGLLLRDSAMCAGSRSASSGVSPYTGYGVPRKAGELFLGDPKIGEKIESERQIPYEEYGDITDSGEALSASDLIDEALKRNPTTHQSWETANALAASLAASKGAY